MNSLLQDLRHSFRMLVKNPGLAITCILTLALGIGLTTTMFIIVNGALYEPLPFEDSQDLRFLTMNNPSEGQDQMGVPIHDFTDWREQQTSFEDLSGWYEGTVNIVSEGDNPIRYDGAFITPSAFTALRIQPLMGRIFTEEERSADALPVILIGYDVWQTRFEGDQEILGRSIRVNGQTSTIIGVMPEGFLFPMEEVLWLPQKQDPLVLPRGDGVRLNVMGRLRQGVTEEQATEEFNAIATRLAAEYPETNEGVGIQVEKISALIMGSEGNLVLHLMLAATFAVMLIACFNVANLLLARASMRTREMAVRTSLGASRRRLIRQLILEASSFSLIGAAIGLILGHIGITIFMQYAQGSDPPYWFKFNIDLNVILFVAGMMLISSVFAGIFPALQASRPNISEILKDESRGASGFRMSRFSKVLVVSEIAFSLGLLFAAGLITRSVMNLNKFDFGIQGENVMTARLGLFETDYPTVESRTQFFRELHAGLNEMPGVFSASITPYLPVRGADGTDFIFEGIDYPPESDFPFTNLKPVTPDYFDTFGIEILQGRDFTSADVMDGLPVAIVNQSFAEKWSPGESPVGKRARGATDGADAPWFTIIGVVADEWTDTENEVSEIAYVSLYQSDAEFVSLALKTGGDPLSYASAIRSAVQSVDHDLPIYWVMPMSEVIFEVTWFYAVFGSMIMIAGLFALFLAAIGLYGVMAFSVSRRTQELGIRMALGAQSGNLVNMIVRQAMVQLTIGVVLGIGLAFALAQGVQMLLFGVSPTDPIMFVFIVAILSGTGIFASFIPARRATRIDPVSALRYE
ncbi:ABC transporter permease [Candidatus Zixiibacteriota bacterium]